ncbi:RHS repeat-associated core domain-containing protein, partial [Streptococcus acidominimus]
MENKDGTTTYTYDKNGNRISSKKNDEQLDYIYDTENRLLAVKDKRGLLMAALYDGDDNRVFTASRKEGKCTYQLFKREEKKSPYTAPNGEEHSLFWYGFSQNVLQALSSLPQTVGTIWHEIFDDVSTAYHKKVAKDRANEEGLVVNPPSIGELPGEGEVTYSSQVKEVLIPYTTREDSFNYYEERNYVNDINREHTEVLQTYDRELKRRETYTYGHGRASYLNHETGDHYNYLTNQSGSVTGLTKEGQAVASTSYNLYGSTKQSTDETGNPYAYNGEARDITGLDYLRARYYDSQAGTFLTEDSYQGQLTNPLSQNRYAYVHNNPVNYTDPSGHVASSPFTMFLGGGKPRYSQPRPLINYEDGTLYAPNTPENKAHQIRQQQTGVYSYTYVPTASAYQYIQQQESQVRAQAHAQAVQHRQQQIRSEYAQATGYYGTPRTREAKNLLRNWGKALKETYTHVCKTAKRVGKQAVNFSKTIDWKKVVSVSAYIAGEFLSVNDIYRLVTGKDPLTGEKASRLEAAAWLTLDVLTLGGSKAGKVAKVATKANKLVDVVKGSKVVSRVNKTVDVVKSSKAVSKANKVIDSGKAYLKSGVNKLLDTPLSLSPRLATAGGSAMNMGRTTLREAGQNVKKGFD